MREHSRPERTPDRLKDRPTWLLGRAAARSSALLAAAFAGRGDGLRGYHYRLLAALEQWGPESQADLGRDTGIDRSDVTGALHELEAQGLVERETDPVNRRRKIVSITPAGRSTLRRLDAVLDEVQDDLLAPLSATQRRQYAAIMARLADS
ncbi:MarR family winged helix-turn-helix transcriptional regulator [Krasilnikoviella flava]|uniref:DNA-binding transcriptional regulator, MarR family n=1 Tax=Krasilnikoviella flava TaxID=526729 RepID=A0A1T5IGI8_9MICO|nr:MarR family transcriptional regulator [Krasilnikoviella flava]SKC38306.1 DNA-binding transcriptional regulator, MarR family [Krasilnikoviella flava]